MVRMDESKETVAGYILVLQRKVEKPSNERSLQHEKNTFTVRGKTRGKRETNNTSIRMVFSKTDHFIDMTREGN